MEGMHELKNVAIRMVEAPPLYSREKLEDPGDVVRVLGKELEAYDREVLCVVNLRNDLSPINMNIASMGSLNSSIVSAREVFKSSILSNAGFIMLVHNHTSGNLAPSKADIKVTGQIAAAAELLNIPLVDHVILGHRGEYFSFHENGLLGQAKGKTECVAEQKRSICMEIREHSAKEGRGLTGQAEKDALPGRQGRDSRIKNKGEGR